MNHLSIDGSKLEEIKMEDKSVLKGIGIRLAESRKAARYTQERLANETGLSVKMLSAAENGRKAMRPENIVKICECLSISTDYLLRGKVTSLDSLAGTERIAALSDKQREALCRIVNDFLSAFDEES